MQITLRQSEIESAITDWLSRQGISSKIEEIAFTAGRGTTGLTADVELGSAQAPTSVPTPRTTAEPVPAKKVEKLLEAPPEKKEDPIKEEEEAPAAPVADKKKALFGG